MARRLILLLVIGACVVWSAWLGGRVQTMGDYPSDYAPAMNALLAGHLGVFFAHLPTNGAGGSVLLRAPAAGVGKLLVGGQLAIFRFGAVLCLLALALLGVVLARGMRDQARPGLERAAVIGLCLLTPAVLDAILFGHPEEPLGAALCAGAVLAAGAGRAGTAGTLLGLAIINKPWGVLAIGPVTAAVWIASEHGERSRRGEGGRGPPGRRGASGLARASIPALAIAGGWTAGAYALDPHHFARIVLGASTAVVAHPQDLWWPLAHVHVVPDITHGYLPPAFIGAHARELIVLLSLPLTLVLLARRQKAPADCLALLALLFGLRCLLDPSNHVYYQVPFVVALAAWEARTRGMPALALIALGGCFATFHTVAGTGSLEAQFLVYVALMLPLLGALGARVLRGTPQGSAMRAGYRPGRDPHRARQPLPG